MGDKTRFLLAGHAGFYNRGCEAIIRCTAEIIRQHVPDSFVTLRSHTATEDAAIIRRDNVPVDEVIEAEYTGAPKPSLAWLWQTIDRRLLWGNIHFNEYLSRRLYDRFDVLMHVGGDNLTEEISDPRGWFDGMRLAKRGGGKVVVWAASMGPFRRRRERWFAETLAQADLITVRETATQEYLDNLGVRDNVKLVADPALLLEPSPPDDDPLPEGECDVTLGIGMSNLVHVGTPMTPESYVRAFAEFIRRLAGRLRLSVVLVPHVSAPMPRQDDTSVCRALADQVGDACPVSVLPDTLRAGEMKHCIGRCDVFMGARTHSTIASLSSCVPTVAIGYSRKAYGILGDLLGGTDLVVPIQEVGPERLETTFDLAWSRADEIRDALDRRIPRMRELAGAGGEYLAQALRL